MACDLVPHSQHFYLQQETIVMEKTTGAYCLLLFFVLCIPNKNMYHHFVCMCGCFSIVLLIQFARMKQMKQRGKMLQECKMQEIFFFYFFSILHRPSNIAMYKIFSRKMWVHTHALPQSAGVADDCSGGKREENLRMFLILKYLCPKDIFST